MHDASAAEVDEHSLLRAVWDGAADALALSDPEGRVVLANPAYYRLFGYAPDEVIGQSFALIFPEHERSAAEAAYRAVFADPAAPEAFEAVVRRKDGSERVVEARIDFVVEGGRRTAMVNTIRDITGRARLVAAERAARARAEDLDRQKEEVIAAVVHDVRSPLTAARVYAEVLGRRAAQAGDDVDPAVAGIAAGVNRALGLLDELADVDQGRHGEAMLLRRAPLDLVVLAREAVADHAAAAGDHGLRIEAGYGSVCGTWDARRLRRALDNLVGNAVKYSPAGSEVVVRVAEEADASGRWAMLSVQDRGIGVPADEQARVFEPFHRAANAAHVAGTGIGLTSVRRIAEAHGGAVSLESREGIGTTVTLRLPLEG